MVKKDQKVAILLKDVTGPSFFLWKWTKKDYEKSVNFIIDDAKVDFKFSVDSFYDREKELPDRQMPMCGQFIFTIENPSKEFLDGLENPSGLNAQYTTQTIYDLYEKALEKIIFYGRWVAKLTSIVDGVKTYPNELFSGGFLNTNRVYWRVGDKEWKPFVYQPKLKGKINPLFKSKNLLTTEKWEKISQFAKTKTELGKEIEELLRIKSKVAWRGKRIPTVEIAALMEVIIRNKARIILKIQGQSTKKIENEEVALSALLNVVLPLIISRTDMKKHKKNIDALDLLRKVRNDIMHKNIQENEIDLETIKKGVDAAIKITYMLNNKIV